MKKPFRLLLCFLAILTISPAAAQADMGPKPSVVIDFTGLEGRRYYATLLSSQATTGPFSAVDAADGAYDRYPEGDAERDIFLKFAEYRDSDGFYFLQNFGDCTQSQRFSWTYYPPQEFKVLLYFPDTDSFLAGSQIYQRYAFDSYFRAGIQADGSLHIAKSYNYMGEGLSLLARILLTLAIELGLALLFGLRQKRRFRFIVLVNVITQLGLNVALNIIDYSMGFLGFILFYFLLEFVVFLAEAILYAIYLKKLDEQPLAAWKPWVYALVANAASFVLGMGLAVLFEAIL